MKKSTSYALFCSIGILLLQAVEAAKALLKRAELAMGQVGVSICNSWRPVSFSRFKRCATIVRVKVNVSTHVIAAKCVRVEKSRVKGKYLMYISTKVGTCI
jgi:hypothetical protein